MKKLNLLELNRLNLDEFKQIPKKDIIIILDNIRSALNIGSIFRTSDAFLVKKIVLTGICATPPNRELLKTAIGATDSVSWEYEENVRNAVLHCKQEGYKIIGIEQTTTSILVDDYPKHEHCALIFGNEVGGIDDSILDLLDVSIEIPQYGTKHSLNVAVCAGIVIWEFCK
jgi:23S rRNA (guanosine2251-2'-O)-methyltransferase